MEKLMQNGQNIIICPGGAEECTITSSAQYRIIINKRLGFIKLALKYGYTLYPTFAFNENKLYYTTDKLMNQRLKFMEFFGTGIFPISSKGIFPETGIDLYWVVGKGI